MKKLVLVTALALSLISNSILACTGIRLETTGGDVVYGRTLEFGKNIDSEIIVVPRGYAYVGVTPDGQPGLSWKTQYAFMGPNASQLPVTVDGINEKGLAVGLFYFPGYAGYQKTTPADDSKTIGPWQLGTWILGNFRTVAEVKAHINDIKVANVNLAAWGIVPPVHYIVHDRTGNSLVIEYVNGELHTYDNPIGVFTNSPTFDWQMTNLRNYLNLFAINIPERKMKNITLKTFGQGSGLVGLPGDFTAPSRFVRAFVLTQSAVHDQTTTQTVAQAFHILNQFDIPVGVIRDRSNGEVAYDYTQWTTVADLTNLRYYVTTAQDRDIRYVDLMKQNLDAKDIVYYPINQTQTMQALTGAQTKPAV